MERNPRHLDMFILRTSQAQPIVWESGASRLVYRRQPFPRLRTRNQSTPPEDRRCVPLLCVQRFAAGDPLASQTVVVKKHLVYRKKLCGHGHGRVQTSDGKCAMVTCRGSGFLFPSVLEGGEMGELALTPVQMATNLHAARCS